MSRADAPLTVAVPVYDEGANIARWWAEARPFLPPGTAVRMVYDFDEDDTLPVVRELVKGGAPFTLLRNEGSGARAAILTGLRSATEGPVLVSMADCSDDFSVLPRMIAEYRAGADVVVASRYAPGGRQIGGPWLKGQLSRWGGRSLRWLARFPTSDATNSYRLYDAAFVQGLDLSGVGGFELAFEITLAAWIAGQRVAEVPATWRDRTHGSSRFDLRRLLPRYARLWLAAMRHGLLRRPPGAGRPPAGSARAA